MSTRDFSAEIKTRWGMEQTDLVVNFQPVSKGTKDQGTTPSYTSDGKLSVNIAYDPAMDGDILWHEGAHAYLFHLGYPPVWPTPRTHSIGMPLDVINEYVATKLEVDRRYETQSERTEVLRHRLDNALKPLPMRPHQPHPGSGSLAVAAAIYGEVARQWTVDLALEANQHLAKTPPKLNTMYWAAVETIRQAPAIPFGSARLTDANITAIKSLISTSFAKIYGEAYAVRFEP